MGMRDDLESLLASALRRDRERNGLKLLTGVVTAVDLTNKRADVRLGSDAVATGGIPYTKDMTAPVVGDGVLVLKQGTARFVIFARRDQV